LQAGTSETTCFGSHCLGSKIGTASVAGFYRADGFTTDTCLGYQLKRAQSLLRALLETAFEKEELNFSQWTVLARLRDGVASNSAELSRSLHYDTGSLTRLLDQLEQRKLVVRRRSRSDRRVHDLALTPAGHAMVTALTPRVVDIHNRVLAGFSRTEAEHLLRSIGKLVSGIETVNIETDNEALPRRLRA
jgi:DNA-binding MarR family transcriptional regulator